LHILRKRKTGEREQRERRIDNICYCFHVFISFCWFVLPFTEVLSQIRSEVTRKVGEAAVLTVKVEFPRWRRHAQRNAYRRPDARLQSRFIAPYRYRTPSWGGRCVASRERPRLKSFNLNDLQFCFVENRRNRIGVNATTPTTFVSLKSTKQNSRQMRFAFEIERQIVVTNELFDVICHVSRLTTRVAFVAA
jgi:hypothetical protein